MELVISYFFHGEFAYTLTVDVFSLVALWRSEAPAMVKVQR